MKKDHSHKKLIKIVVIYFGSIIVMAFLFMLYCFGAIPSDIFQAKENLPSYYYMDYDASVLNDSKENELLKYGMALFQKTPQYIGPDNGNPEMIYQGNRLACKNCHLNSGTKAYSAPLIGIIQRFPQFRGRENKIGTIEERINGCMERSMNGKILPTDGKEMRALVAYLNWLSRYAPSDGNIKGKGFLKIKIPNRAVDLDHGRVVFFKHCIVCHGTNGQGVKSVDGYTYEYPPLWGENSFNHGAGMTRVITAAQFIKGNMPFGTNYYAPVLTDEEAYDVAGFINSQDRPKKSHPEKDFPDLKKKPVSTPYPPYADSFPVEQHQKGPFQPIMAYYKEKFNITKTK
ncbi:c-type cytochrome [Tamlana fucoidanivorans]|uniref:C-type cytochrome n=1 Tax=Allotamlana fucoidanivorans TaxID=2583814 RepID=A0A5C4SDM4_9FLAO|nr:c-type cytochrome [Tamlana fucoidanivorans]TNJ41472.1 c-type cytochrome [Tamlana fucoidanivorans]